MARRSMVAVSGSLLSISGLVILVMAGNQAMMSLFGSQALSAPETGDSGWVGVGFTRLFGAALASLGLVMMATRPLSDPAAKTIGGPLFAGLGLLTLVTIIQAQAIWSAPAGWALATVLLVGCVGAGQLTRPSSAPPGA